MSGQTNLLTQKGTYRFPTDKSKEYFYYLIFKLLQPDNRIYN